MARHNEKMEKSRHVDKQIPFSPPQEHSTYTHEHTHIQKEGEKKRREICLNSFVVTVDSVSLLTV